MIIKDKTFNFKIKFSYYWRKYVANIRIFLKYLRKYVKHLSKPWGQLDPKIWGGGGIDERVRFIIRIIK